MSAPKLKALLAKGPLVSDNLKDAVALCGQWYLAEPSTATLALFLLCEHLAGRDWTVQQGAPAAQYQPFEIHALPALVRLVDAMVATPSREPVAETDALSVAYCTSLRATP
jgi:hypothetical protein